MSLSCLTRAFVLTRRGIKHHLANDEAVTI